MRAKVEIRNKRTGAISEVAVRQARVLILTGKFEEVPPPPLPDPDYDALSYAELYELVKERGVETDGRSKGAYIEALRRGTYARRDMRAE